MGRTTSTCKPPRSDRGNYARCEQQNRSSDIWLSVVHQTLSAAFLALTHGFLRYQDWKFYGERGLAKEKVTVWIYEGSLRVEKEAVTLSQYEVSMLGDHKHVQAVRSARAHETPFRSPQLALFDLGPHEWLLYWKNPSTAPARRKRHVEGIVQPLLFDPLPEEKAVGANEGVSATRPRPLLHLIAQPSGDKREE